MNKLFQYKFYLTLVLLFSLTIYLYAFSGGVTGKTKKNGNGCTCHGSFSSNVNVVIEGPENMSPGETKEFSLIISGGPLLAGGTNISASAGELIAGLGTQLLGNELTHSQPKLSSEGKVIFPFSFTAPSVEAEVTLFANGNSVNLDGTNSGDSWNFAPNKIIAVKNPTDINEEFTATNFYLSQNYPNPFNPTTKISFVIPNEVKNLSHSRNTEYYSEKQNVTLKVYDVLGREVATLVNEQKPAGSYEAPFDASKLSSGIYFYRLKAGSFVETKKMILIK